MFPITGFAMPVDSPSEPNPIALCLSGGGFRATFFHLGVVKYLSEIGLLQQIKYVFSVSGGSILAAHIALNWNRYTSSDTNVFREAADELVEFGQLDLRGRIIRRSAFIRRTLSLERYYQDLFGKHTLNSLPSTPRFYFLATSMASGRLCAFDRDGFIIVNEHDAPGRYDPAKRFPTPTRYTTNRVRISQAVAASSAFPPLFPPLILGEDEGLPPQSLTDGGIFDNLGISRIFPLVSWYKKKRIDPIIVSDASAPFEDEHGSKFAWLVPRTIRTTDILMRRVASLENEHWYKHKRLKVIDIADVLKEHEHHEQYRPQDQSVQSALKKVRTDLDFFEPELIRCLAGHGHEIAFKTLRSLSEPSGQNDNKPWNPISPHDIPPSGEKLQQLVEAAATRRLGFWNASDSITWWVILGLIAPLLVAFFSVMR